jgi:hypothetical protein
VTPQFRPFKEKEAVEVRNGSPSSFGSDSVGKREKVSRLILIIR